MILFIMNMGWMLLLEQFITERARTTARAGAVNTWTSADAANFFVYGTTTAPHGGGPGYLGLLSSQVSYQALGSSDQSDYRVQVSVSGVPAVMFWMPYLAGSYALPPIHVTVPAQSLGAN